MSDPTPFEQSVLDRIDTAVNIGIVGLALLIVLLAVIAIGSMVSK